VIVLALEAAFRNEAVARRQEVAEVVDLPGAVEEPDRSRSAATRARIAEAAGRLFAERGYGATTLDAVASAADVTIETVYARFQNKRTCLPPTSTCRSSVTPSPHPSSNGPPGGGACRHRPT
jgi:hypothetical protein